MATIEDVARMAGVSPATVSRVLNGNYKVKPNTEERVRKAIQTLSYVPNFAARNLRRNESMAAMIVAPNFTNPFYSHILAGIGDAAQTLGYSVFIYNMADPEAVRQKIEYTVKNHRADGIILLANPYDASWIAEYSAELPIVQCCEYAEGIEPALPHIAIDNYQAAYEAVEYLLNLGHRRIAHISSTNSHISTKLRREGYCDALRAFGVTPREEYIVQAGPDYSYHTGYALSNKLFGLKERPSAVFCISDILALSAIAAANDRGLRVPGDVSVLGFDDVDYTTMFHPYLSTIMQPCYELGRRSMQVLHEFKSTFPAATQVPPMPHKLRIRESTAPCQVLHE
ncbi:LacI family DNA-binding transcriptional regulator [Christensenellaceae bacterium OttesenSCG-928-L17]|nr:LacI family DNA-binding transcriptional regulator [Christensenellaceae bacterium OttesenSCG-928-L17]